MKFSVAPESSRAGASVLRCAAWTYAFRIIDFWLDMYTFSDVFLSHAVCARRASTSSFWEVGSSVLSLWSLAESSLSCSVVPELSSGRLNVTDLSLVSDSLFMSFTRLSTGSVSSSSDSLESHNVSLFVESSSVIGRGVVSGFRSFSKRFMQRRVGCSPPHSLHCSGGPMSSLIRSAYVQVGCSVLCSTFCFRASANAFRKWLEGVHRSDSYFARFFKAWASFFGDLLG